MIRTILASSLTVLVVFGMMKITALNERVNHITTLSEQKQITCTFEFPALPAGDLK